jgi:hypothetical protein
MREAVVSESGEWAGAGRVERLCGDEAPGVGRCRTTMERLSKAAVVPPAVTAIATAILLAQFNH